MYANVADMIKRVDLSELLELTNAHEETLGIKETALIESALGDVSSIMDGYIRVRHSLPLKTVPDLLVKICCDMALFELYRLNPTEAIKDKADKALKILNDISKGVVLLTSETGEVPPQGSNVVLSGTSERLFSQETMNGF